MSLAIATLEIFIDDVEALVAREHNPRKVVAGVAFPSSLRLLPKAAFIRVDR